MIVPIIAVLCLQLPTPPPIAVGCRPEFQQVVHAVQESLTKGDFAQAQKDSELLPKGSFTIGWDGSSIPESLRPQVDEMRDLVIQAWRHIKPLDIKVAASGDVNINFSKDLPKDPSGLPVASRWRFGINPRVNVTIGLIRGVPSQSIIPADAYMEIGHAIGAYLGVADDALPGNCMYRDDHPALRAYGPSTANYLVAARNLELSAFLRTQAQSKVSLAIPSPQLSFSPTVENLGSVRQGLRVPLDFKIKNSGPGPLSYNLVPDCGCFTKAPPGTLKAGEEATVRTVVNTSEYVGEVHKLLVLYSNDPQHPVEQIPVTFTAAPAFRLYRPEGDTVILPTAKDSVDILLTLPKDSKIIPAQYQWSGIGGKLTMEKWSGIAPDPDLNEPPAPRQGYIFHLKLNKSLVAGRSSGTLLIQTGDEQYPELSYTLYAQKGIVALPQEVFLGEMVGVVRGTFIVSRPGKPFKILSVDCGSASLKPVVTKVSDSEYRLDVICDGSSPKGDFIADIRIHTSDPTQPTLITSIRGTVR